MATISAQQECMTAIVTFTCEPEKQDFLSEKVRAYVDDFISQQAGLISSHVHKSICGKHVVNYAQWKDLESFIAFSEKAVDRPELPVLFEFDPQPVFYKVDFSVDGPQ